MAAISSSCSTQLIYCSPHQAKETVESQPDDLESILHIPTPLVNIISRLAYSTLDNISEKSKFDDAAQPLENPLEIYEAIQGLEIGVKVGKDPVLKLNHEYLQQKLLKKIEKYVEFQAVFHYGINSLDTFTTDQHAQLDPRVVICRSEDRFYEKIEKISNFRFQPWRVQDWRAPSYYDGAYGWYFFDPVFYNKPNMATLLIKFTKDPELLNMALWYWCNFKEYYEKPILAALEGGADPNFVFNNEPIFLSAIHWDKPDNPERVLTILKNTKVQINIQHLKSAIKAWPRHALLTEEIHKLKADKAQSSSDCCVIL